MVNKIIPFRSKTVRVNPVADGVLRVRNFLGYTQTQMAQALGVSQANVAKWEMGKLNPPGPVCAAISRLAPDEEKEWWRSLAGFTETPVIEDSVVRKVPLLRDALAAGTPRAINENEIETVLAFPKSWLPIGGKITAFHVKGDSMSPYINDGYIVLIDETQRDPEKLINKMIAARDDDGVTIKWLRQDVGLYLLVPQSVTANNPVRVLKREDGWGIVGAVVKFIGDPPRTKKKHGG